MNVFTRLKIRTQLLILAVSVILIMLSIIFIYYSRISENLSSRNIAYTSEIINQTKEVIESNCSQFDMILLHIASMDLVQEFLSSTQSYNLKSIEYDKDLKSFAINIMNYNSSILDIIILGEDGSHFDLYGKYRYAEGLQEKIDTANKTYYSEMMPYVYGDITYSSITAGIGIYSVKQGKNIGKRIGTAAIVINMPSLVPKMNEVEKKQMTNYYLLDRSGLVYYSNDTRAAGRQLSISSIHKTKNISYSDEKIIVNKNDCIINSKEISYINGRITSVTPRDEILSDIGLIRKQALFMFLAGILILIFPFTLIIKNIILPLNKFIVFMKQLGKGNFTGLKKRIVLDGYAEISIMAESFNRMLDEIQNLTKNLLETTKNLYESKLRQKHSELAFLRSQINPHFLYNTLESIKGMALVKGADEIWEMTRALGLVFRYCVKGDNMVLLSDELEVVKSYIRIQQIRFSNRFEVIYRVTSDALNTVIPKMILQPIVENAIYHGLEPLKNGGRLLIEGDINHKKDLVIHVKDDGPGMHRKILNKLYTRLNETPREYICSENNLTGIGIINVNNRIKLLYGNQYGLDLYSEMHKGTEVTITIPGSFTKHNAKKEEGASNDV